MQYRFMVATRAPEPAKWTSRTMSNGARRIFKCRPHACAAPDTVTFTFQTRSPKPPDPKALEKFATVGLPKAIRAVAVARTVMTGIVERIETLYSKTTTLKNYPAALNETKFSRHGTDSVYLKTGVIFAGPLIIHVDARSPNRRLASQSFNDFVDVMQIVETQLPPRKPLVPQTPKTQSL